MNTKYNIILDLDQTVIAGELESDLSMLSKIDLAKLDFYGKKFGKHIFYTSSNKDSYVIFGRPYLQEFLDILFMNFNVSVWTAASSDYAKFVIKHFILNGDPNRKLDFIYTRHNCELIKCKEEGDFLSKPLTKIYNKFPSYNENNTFIIDDNFDVFKIQCNNCIRAPPFEILNKRNNPKTKYTEIVKNMSGSCFNDSVYNDTFLASLIPKLWTFCYYYRKNK